MKSIRRTLALAAGIAAWSIAAAQGQPAAPEHSTHHAPASTAAMADGEVRKIDKEQGKLTLRQDRKSVV